MIIYFKTLRTFYLIQSDSNKLILRKALMFIGQLFLIFERLNDL